MEEISKEELEKMPKDKINSDKYVVYVEPPSTSHPVIRIWACDGTSSMKRQLKNMDGRPFYKELRKKPIEYEKIAKDIGMAILKDSKIINEWND